MSVSTTFTGVSLTTVAFITALTPHSPQKTEDIIVVIMLSSSVLFFWSLAFHFIASLPFTTTTKNKVRENQQQLFKHGYALITAGAYLFFMGLLWSLSGINPLYCYTSAIAYFVIFGLLFISFRMEGLNKPV